VAVLKKPRDNVTISMKITLPITIAGKNATANTFNRGLIFFTVQAVGMRHPLGEQGTDSDRL